MTPGFLVTCAVNHIADAEVSAWVHSGERRAHFERFAALVLESSHLPDIEKRAATAREILHGFERRER